MAQLGTPQAVAAENNGIITIVWPAVDNAEYYYVYVDVEESQVGNTEYATVTDNTNYALSNLQPGEHTIYVFAMTDNENYSLSEGFKLTFITAENELWRNEASYYSETIDATFPVQVVAYEDGSYTITNGSQNYLYYVSGPEAIDVIYYYDGQYSSFQGDQTKGSLYFYYYY